MRYSAAIITVSDKGSVGEREDKSGPALRAVLETSYDVNEMVIIPDEVDIIAQTIKELIDTKRIDLIGFVLNAIPHTLEKLQGDTRDCAVLRDHTGS